MPSCPVGAKPAAQIWPKIWFLQLTGPDVHVLTPETRSSPSARPLLQPGRNCWRIERSSRFGLLIDADAYFTAVRSAILQARHSVFILSWDIDSRTVLAPGSPDDGYPAAIGDFLHAVLAERPQLRIYVLNWDFAMLYALERELLPAYRTSWRRHRGMAFHMDSRHPVGASHHQKVVVVDDSIAFVGGLDITKCRWDTPEHASDNALRCDADGVPYGPFHDVQAVLDGEAAAALGELARARWTRATGHAAAPSVPSVHDAWPAAVEPDVRNVDVAIARTEPTFDGASGVFEVRQLYLDAIASARRHLFFENQYFTSDTLCNALSERLREEDPPEIMVISPKNQSGWLEQATMGALRARVHQRLKATDDSRRYRMYCPYLPGLADGCLNVHSKVFTVDDELFCVGSANMSNRSMAFDTECNLALEAPPGEAGDTVRAAIARMRARLLGEHLGAAPDVVVETVREHGLLRTVDLLRNERRLETMDPAITPEMEMLTVDNVVFDPERPITPDELVAQFVPKDARKPVPQRLIGLGLLALALVLLTVAWRATPLRDTMNLASMIGMAERLQYLPFTPAIAIASFMLAASLMVPVTLLIAVTGIVFGPFYGALYAIVGSTLSAALTYGLGVWVGRETVRDLLGARINRLSRRIAKRGVLAVMVVRVLPVAPFAVVNVVAGASHIRLRDFLIGTVLGMAPGIVLTVTFVHHLAEAARRPTAGTIAVLVLMGVVLIASALGLQKLFARREAAWKN
ncbi:Phosphatidylserine/phosphatidylglycerophosphate/cardiolipin synthase [Noviherbaspirillum suwonense]|uniref:Phosphatidylserine/phosphatidylglycerophosphate/cardiolipin synthase n=1 Tax=Noviherbaspirillum suwonense TaxID=1224511 RepID=A0ABY1QJG6_9BURK|nr:Phosphatidylserine/phosphatidylglycerophosphate/cardiolipin synthase [Noviherbaspirillum suwonense]